VKWDANDVLRERGPEGLRKYLDDLREEEIPDLDEPPPGEHGPNGGGNSGGGAGASEWPAPDMRIVEDDRAPTPALDDDALPAGWGEWITKEAASRGCPRDYVASSLITGASIWIGNARHVAATPTWTEPANVWMALIGDPSTGKTPGARTVIEACRDVEKDAEPKWQAAMEEHNGLAEAARAITEQWRAAVREATKKGEPVPMRPPGADAPPEPPQPRVLVMDSTTEKLQQLLAGQPRGLLWARDELSGWLGNLDRYGGNGGDRAFFLEAWNGGVYVVDRVKHGDKPVRIPRATVALFGGIQPDRLKEALAGADDGLAARFAYVWPELPPIEPLPTEPDAAARGRRERLTSAALRLYGLPMDDTAGDPAPRLMPLDKEAFVLFDELRQEALQRVRSSRGLAKGWHGKTPGRALRLALIFELLAWAAANDRAVPPRMISADAMARVGAHLDYLAAMFDKVTSGLAISRAEFDAAAIARHILLAQSTTLNERALYQQQGWSWLRDTERRGAAVRVLTDAGWIRRAAQPRGGRPRGDWEVSPRLWEKLS
jgi:hypothetical protein